MTALPSPDHSTLFPDLVYWDCWLLEQHTPRWRIRLHLGAELGYRGPTFTCFRAEELIRFVATHDRIHPVRISDLVHPAIAEALARRLLAAGLVAFSPYTTPFDLA